MSKHTKAPWWFSYNGPKHDAQVQAPNCDVAIAADIGMREQHAEDERKANGNLIAAAPELLQALRDLIDGPLGGLSGEEFTQRSALLEAARAAIAKAEGKP